MSTRVRGGREVQAATNRYYVLDSATKEHMPNSSAEPQTTYTLNASAQHLRAN
jgi:hypothetical protein